MRLGSIKYRLGLYEKAKAELDSFCKEITKLEAGYVLSSENYLDIARRVFRKKILLNDNESLPKFIEYDEDTHTYVGVIDENTVLNEVFDYINGK